MTTRKQGSANALILNSKRQILFLKRSAMDTYLPKKWELPGGGIKDSETLEQALKREVKEECGLEIDIIKPFAVNKYFIKDLQRIEVSFLCLKKKDQKVKLSKEHADFIWLEFANIKQLKLDSYIHKLLESAKEYLLQAENL